MTDEDKSKILDKIKKLKALANSGVGGERANAQILMDQLISKYNLEDELLSLIDDEEVSQYRWYYKNDFEKKILLQVIGKVLDDKFNCTEKRWISNGHIDKHLYANCTKSQSIEIEVLSEFYNTLWKSEVDVFMSAFIQKHRLFPENYTKDDDDDEPMDREKRLKMYRFMDGMDDKSPLKQISYNE